MPAYIIILGLTALGAVSMAQRERWRNVVGYEGLYLVSDQGRVMSLPRIVPFGRNERLAEGGILSQAKDKDGYLQVVLSNGVDGRKNGKVHRLVADAFIPNPESLETVDHINSDKTDNRASNLRWCSIGDNLRFARKNGRFSDPKPEVIRALIERTARPVIRDDGETYPSVMDAARALGVTDNAVQAVLHGRNHTCCGHKFKYIEESEYVADNSGANSSGS